MPASSVPTESVLDDAIGLSVVRRHILFDRPLFATGRNELPPQRLELLLHANEGVTELSHERVEVRDVLFDVRDLDLDVL